MNFEVGEQIPMPEGFRRMIQHQNNQYRVENAIDELYKKFDGNLVKFEKIHWQLWPMPKKKKSWGNKKNYGGNFSIFVELKRNSDLDNFFKDIDEYDGFHIEKEYRWEESE